MPLRISESQLYIREFHKIMSFSFVFPHRLVPVLLVGMYSLPCIRCGGHRGCQGKDTESCSVVFRSPLSLPP